MKFLTNWDFYVKSLSIPMTFKYNEYSVFYIKNE